MATRTAEVGEVSAGDNARRVHRAAAFDDDDDIHRSTGGPPPTELTSYPGSLLTLV